MASTMRAQHVVAARTLDGGAGLAVDREQVDPVAGPGGERGEQQRGVEGGVEAGHVADPAGRGAAGVEDEQQRAVALRAPGAHDHVLPPGGGPPVDRADVVALDVVAQRVELGALPALAHRDRPVELPQPGQPLRQVLARGRTAAAPARRQGTSWRPCRAAMPSGPTERTVTRSGSRSPRRVGLQDGRQHPALPGRQVERCVRGPAPAEGTHASRSTPRSGRGPGLATGSATSTRSPSRQAVAPERLRRSAPTGAASSASASASDGQQDRDDQHRPGRGQQQHRQDAEQGEQRGPAGERHVGPSGGRGPRRARRRARRRR